MMSKLLIFSEFRIEWAKELKQDVVANRALRISMEYSVLSSYKYYLRICGYEWLSRKITPFLRKTHNYNPNNNMDNKNWDVDYHFVRDMNNQMDKFVKKELKKYKTKKRKKLWVHTIKSILKTLKVKNVQSNSKMENVKEKPTQLEGILN